MLTRDEIVQQALALPPDDRVYVADAMERSFNEGGFSSPEIAAAWMDEIESRLAAYDRGDANAIPASLAIDNIRGRLARHRDHI